MREDRAFYYSPEWKNRQTQAGCGAEDLTMHHSLYFFHFKEAGSIALAAGAFFGQFFEYRFLVNSRMMDSSAWLWYRTDPVKVIIRLALTGLILAICMLPTKFAE